MSDGICQKCLLPNPTWFATNALWNAVTEHWTEPEFPGRARIMCPSCFIGLAESQGMVPTAWILTPEMPSRKWTHEQRPPAPADPPTTSQLPVTPNLGVAHDQSDCLVCTSGNPATFHPYYPPAPAPADPTVCPACDGTATSCAGARIKCCPECRHTPTQIAAVGGWQPPADPHPDCRVTHLVPVDESLDTWDEPAPQDGAT